MTVAAQTVSQSQVAAGAQTAFNFTFRCDDASALVVYVNDALQPAPAVVLNADQVGNPGGTVTIGARLVGDIVTVERVSPQTQQLATTAYGPFPSVAIALGLDRIVMLFQELAAVVGRAFRVPRSQQSNISTFDLPSPVVGQSLGWGQDGVKFKLVNLGVAGGGGSQPFRVMGEALADSGDHTNFTLAHIPVGAPAVYRNGQRIFSVDDYNLAGLNLAVLVPLVAGEKLNADYNY